MYFYFFGNKVQLLIGDKKSEFVYFSKNVKYEDLIKIIKKLDESNFK
jgi:biopolymer transport protein ExbD